MSSGVRPMPSVFVLQHCHVLPTDEDDVKVIGVYASRRDAEAAVERLRLQPGFIDHPRIVDPEADDDRNGFYIDEYPIGKDHWTEGYVTV
nr:putative integron gene cassette protein [uncultured bacterium]CAS02958.1 putative integron gene cassette protein [uncultured bacterium]